MIEQKYAEGSMQNPPWSTRHETMRQVLIYVTNNSVILIHHNHL